MLTIEKGKTELCNSVLVKSETRLELVRASLGKGNHYPADCLVLRSPFAAVRLVLLLIPMRPVNGWRA